MRLTTVLIMISLGMPSMMSATPITGTTALPPTVAGTVRVSRGGDREVIKHLDMLKCMDMYEHMDLYRYMNVFEQEDKQ